MVRADRAADKASPRQGDPSGDGGRTHVTAFPPTVHRVTEIKRPAPGSLEARASLALKILALINAVGVVLAMFSPLLPVSNLLAVAFSAAAGVLAVLYVIEARALDHRRPGAVTAARPLLACLVVSGGFSVLVALDGGAIRAPFEGILAVWALLGRRDITLAAGAARRAAAFVVAAAGLLIIMAFAQPLFGWGGLVDVHEPDLNASLTVECGDVAEGMPPAISIRYDWSWRFGSPYPNERDIIVIGWTGRDGQGRPLYVIDDIPGSASGIYSGRAGFPSTAMATEIAGEFEASFRWAIDLTERGYEPGRIELHLRRPHEDPPGPNSVTFNATYVHLGIWRSDATSVTCSW